MVGRGAMRNPWSLLQIAQHLRGEQPIQVDRDAQKSMLLLFLNKHHDFLRHEKATLGKFKQIAKHFCSELPNGSLLRSSLLRAQSIDEIIQHTELFFSVSLSQTRCSRFGASQCPLTPSRTTSPKTAKSKSIRFSKLVSRNTHSSGSHQHIYASHRRLALCSNHRQEVNEITPGLFALGDTPGG